MRRLVVIAIALLAGCSTQPATGTSSSGGASSSGSNAGSGATTSNSTGSTASTGSSSTGSAASTSSSTGGSGSTTSSSTGGITAPWVMGYYVGYQRDLYPPDKVDYTALTHLAISRITPNPDGTLNETFDIDATNGPAMAQDLSTRAHQAGIKVVLMIGGAGEHAGWVGAASSANRSAFEQALLAAVTRYDADGLDLDWEPIDSADEAPLTALVQDLRAARPSLIITIPIGYLNPNIDSVPQFLVDLAPQVDRLNVMSYEMAVDCCGWDSWHSSALAGESPTTPTSISSTIAMYRAAGVAAEKLGIGMGFYGICYSSPVTGPKQSLGGSQIVASDNDMSFTNIMSDYYLAADAHFDASAKVPYLSFSSPQGPQSCTYISYEDAQSIGEKASYVKAQGLGGAIIWTINEGYLPNAPAGDRDPLMEALRQFRQ